MSVAGEPEVILKKDATVVGVVASRSGRGQRFIPEPVEFRVAAPQIDNPRNAVGLQERV